VIVEKLICDTLATALGIEVYFGAQPQPADTAPAPLPVAIVQRPQATFLNTLCGADVSLAMTQINLDVYADSAEESRSLHDTARATLATLSDVDPGTVTTLSTEWGPTYDALSRGWRVHSEWLVPDYAPVLP
jgi:hypothetical protein